MAYVLESSFLFYPSWMDEYNDDGTEMNYLVLLSKLRVICDLLVDQYRVTD